MLRDDRHLPSSSPSMWRELSLHYNGGTTNVMADCRHTKTLGELLSQTLFANHPSPRGAEGSVLKEIESRYRCESSDGIAVSFSLPTHLVPGELYLSVKGGGQHALIGSEVPSTTSAIPATTTRGRGRGRGRGGRGPGRRKRVEEEAEMENGENSEPSENEASSEASDEDDDDESSAAESAEEEQNGGNKRGRGRGAGRGRGRGRPPATVRGKTTTTAAAAAAAAGAKRASSSSPVAATAPQMMMIQQGMIEVPMKRKRGRPPKNPPMMLVPATEAMLAAAAAAAASSSSSSTRATAARRRGAAGALDTARATSGEATVDATSAWLDSVSHEDGHASSFPSSPTTTSAMRERHTRGGDAESLAAVGRRGRAAAADRDGSPASSSVSAGPSKGHLPPMMDVAEVLRPVRPPPPQRRITATVNCFVREVDGDEVDGVAMHRAEVGRLTTKTVAQQHALFDDALEMKRLQPWSTPLHDEDASSGDPLWAPSLLREESDESSSASSSTTSSAVQAILSTEEAPNTAAVSAAALWQKQGLTPSFMLADANSFLAMPQLCLMDPPTTTTSSTTNVAMKKEEHHQRVSTMAATASWPGHDGCPTSITIPIIVGGCVRLINNESKDRSHRWTVYVRGLHAGFPVASGPNTSATTTTTTTLTNKNDVEDESDYLHRFVDSVTFILDRSFSPCVRTVSSPPFELTEEGWGEFVVSIHVHLRYPVASGSRKAERQRRQLDGFMCGSGGRATLLCSTGPGRAVNALDPITSMNVVSSVCGRGIHTNAQTNADNALVDGLLDINYNSAARSLLYRGPWLPPFLSEDADDDDEEEAMMYGRRRTTPAARRGIQPDGGVVPASPSPSPSSSSPSITSHIIGNASYVNAFLNPTAAVAAAATAASSTSAFPAQPSSSLSSFSSPATTDANANAPSSPHTNTNNNNNTPGSPNAGKRLIASLSRGHSDDVVVLSHLLRFSHRPKPPVLVPPLMDVRGAHLRGEHVATGYALVSEPVVSEQYDEIYIPIDVCDLQEDDDDDDGATRTKLEAEASGHGMKKEDKDDDDEERGIRAGHRRRGRYSRKTAMLLREAGVMERQLRAYLHRHIATGGRELAAVYHHPECCTIKGGVSCWPQIVQHGDAATKDALLTVAFLKSLTATASVEGWLHRALDLHEVAHEHEDGPHTAVGGVLPGPALITKLEFQLATQMMRQHSSRAAMAMFYRDVLPQAVSVGAMVWQAVSAANAVVASAPMHSGSSDGAGGGGGGGGADVGTPSSSSSPPTSQQTGGRGVDFALYPLAAELTTPLPVGGANHITAAGRGRGGGGVAPGHHLGAHHHQHHAHHTNTPPYHLLCQQPLPNTFANGEKSTNFGHDGDMDRLVQMKEALMSSIAEMREEVARRQAICAFETM